MNITETVSDSYSMGLEQDKALPARPTNVTKKAGMRKQRKRKQADVTEQSNSNHCNATQKVTPHREVTKQKEKRQKEPGTGTCIGKQQQRVIVPDSKLTGSEQDKRHPSRRNNVPKKAGMKSKEETTQDVTKRGNKKSYNATKCYYAKPRKVATGNAEIGKKIEKPLEPTEAMVCPNDAMMIANLQKELDDVKRELSNRQICTHECQGISSSVKNINTNVACEKTHVDNASKQTSDPEQLSSEQKLLLVLFMLKKSKRKKYIEKRGIELGVLETHPIYKSCIQINQRVQHHAKGLFVEAHCFIGLTDSTELRTKELRPLLPEKPNYVSFEQQVNHLLAKGKNPTKSTRRQKKEQQPKFPLYGIRDEEQKIVQSELDVYVDQLVKRNVGYLVEGALRVNVHQNWQAFVDVAGREKSVFIGSIILRQCAMEGDIVRVFAMNKSEIHSPTFPGSRPRPTRKCKTLATDVGFVVEILQKHHNRQCIGAFLPTMSKEGSNYDILVPRDARIPPVRLFKQDLRTLPIEMELPRSEEDSEDSDEDGVKEELESTNVTDVCYLAQIIEWQGKTPIGTILKPVDKSELLKFENECILVQHNLNIAPYPADILTRDPIEPYDILQEIGRREDLRGECIFTIDSATAQCLDDALSCTVLQNGHFEVGVHISDVTFFLREQSEVDELAKVKAANIYMVDEVYRMLPEQLCNACSLLPGEDRLAFSVFSEILPDGTVLSTRFARSVINSCAKLSYEQAQMLLDNLDGEDTEESLVPKICHGHTTIQSLGIVLNQLKTIAVKLRQRRIEDGYLEIEQSGYTFWFDTAVDCPIEYDEHTLRKTFDVFMVLTNTSVARAIYTAMPSNPLVRCPQPPREKMIEHFVHSLSQHGYTFSFASTTAIRESMDAIIAEAEHPDAAKIVLNKLLTKYKHHGSPNRLYTSFTSPIRRYTDCMVHRVLAAILGIGEELKRTPDELLQLTIACNTKRYRAKRAGDASLMLCYRKWLNTVEQHETVGAVMGYDFKCIELILIGTGIELEVLPEEISSFASVVFIPAKPTGPKSIHWIPRDSSIQPISLKIFSKIRVTIKLVKDAITVCSILPMVAESTTSMMSS